MRLSMLWALIALLIGACMQRQQSTAITEEFSTGNLSEVGIDSARIRILEEKIVRNEFPNRHSLLIWKDDKLVYEKYFPGEDESWGDRLGVVQHGPEVLHDIRSVSKSVVSALVGIAIDKGMITSENERVFDFFPELAAYDSGIRSQLTLHHLLTMTSGLKWNEDVPYDDPENSEILMSFSDDPVRFVLTQPFEAAPGEKWKYNGGTTQVLAAIVERASEMKIDAFADKFLFTPLGIERFEWTKLPDKDMCAAASGLRLTSRDLLKFALLYHNKGRWQGQRVLSEEWVATSTRNHIEGYPDDGYGYQWYVWGDQGDQKPAIIAAIGNGDQRIFRVPEQNLIVVTTAGNYNKWDIANNAIVMLREIRGAVR